MSKQTSKNSRNRLIGTVRAARDGFGFVELEDHDTVSLGKQDMRTVFPGDVVEVRTGKVVRGRIQGQIVEIMERNTSEIVGSFHAGRSSNSERDFGFVRPSNSRITNNVQVSKNLVSDAQHGQIVVVEITDQPTESEPAYGRIKEVLGDQLAAGMEIQIALRDFDIPHRWPEVVEDQADKLGYSVKTKDKEHRLDLRDKPFVTIDGEDARDFDDAVLAEKRKNGWRLWVAIADVSHYVKPSSALDGEAQERGTSVYFPDYVVPMLPEVLSNGLCSLKPKVDRLALVCEMEIDSKGQINDFRFAEAIIRSHERLTYTRVATVLEEREQEEIPERKKLGVLCEQIDQLHALYEVLFAARQARGAMEFDSVEVRFEFNENRKIEKIVPVHRNDAHKLIEECMLCANICAAEFLEKNEVPSLYRVHMPPADEKLAALREYLTELGLWLGGGDQPVTADFKKLSEAMGDRSDKNLIQTMILRSQQQAVYQPENKGHFGLAYDAYAHFTSPIRRYPDLMVHRAIRSVIRSNKPAKNVFRVNGARELSASKSYPYDLEAVQTLGQTCSLAERRAEEATRDVAQWLKCEYLLKHLGDSFLGVVSSVTHFGLFVQLADLYIEGLIHIANLPNDYYEYDSVGQQLVGQSSRRTFKVADKAMVQVARVDLDERKIDLVLTNSSDESDRPPSAGQRRGAVSPGMRLSSAGEPLSPAKARPSRNDRNRAAKAEKSRVEKKHKGKKGPRRGK